jgi:hypothetical protein
MTPFEITLLVAIIVSILAVVTLSVPSEKGKQMHEHAKKAA